MDFAFQFIIDNGGLDTEEDYPYKGYNERCDVDKVCAAHLLLVTLPALLKVFTLREACLLEIDDCARHFRGSGRILWHRFVMYHLPLGVVNSVLTDRSLYAH
jgi:hypothetical protein